MGNRSLQCRKSTWPEFWLCALLHTAAFSSIRQMFCERNRLTYCFLLVGKRTGAARRTLAAVAQLADVDFEFGDGSTQGIAVHAQLTCSSALIAVVLLQDGHNKSLLELAHCFRIEDVAFIHLHDEGFELISHGISLSLKLPVFYASCAAPLFSGAVGRGTCLRRLPTMQ